MARIRSGSLVSDQEGIQVRDFNFLEIRALFDDLDDVAFFVKNRQFRIVCANRFFFERLGFKNEDEIIGKDDFELFPEPLAQKFRVDDEKVLASGVPMPGTAELFLTRQGLPEWYLTNKRPVFDHRAKPAGVMGTVRRYENFRRLGTFHPEVSKAIGIMKSQPGSAPSIVDLAERLKMSVRNFDRRFKQDTGLTPKQFLGRVKIEKACQVLRDSRMEICDLAVTLGFCDQSAFTAQFRMRMGMTPLAYRKQFGHSI